jgi:glycolate oxidase iron-sulfur subunit
MSMMATEIATGRAQLESLLEQNREGLLTCVHCGLCLPACPTYRVLGNENDSPRGRIYLMRALVEERIEATDSFISHIDLCLGCRGCESVCPSGVPYGQLLEAARGQVADLQASRFSVVSLLTRLVLNQVFTRPVVLRAAMAVARWIRDSGLAWLAFDSGLVRGRSRLALALLLASRPYVVSPEAESQPIEADLKPVPAPSDKEPAKVAVLRGCVMEGLFTATNRATERILTHNGCTLVDVSDQGCCGALHAHAGELETARHLARKNIDAFLAVGPDRIVVNAAGCGAAMKEYGHLLKDDPDYRESSRRFSAAVRDISEVFAEMNMAAPTGNPGRRIAYDAPCHLLHAQRVALPPVDMLKSAPGLQVVPFSGSESCCGGAGIYNLLHPDLSAGILDAKIDSIIASGAEVVATGNPGCIMQIGAGLLLRGIDVAVTHPVDLVAGPEEITK